MSRPIRLLLFFIFFLACAASVAAQAVEFRLKVHRDFGYGNGSDVRGNFSLTIFGAEENIRAVTYQMDGQTLSRQEQAPFKFSYKTGDYPAGWHDLVGIVETKDGRTVTTPVVRLNYVSAEQESQGMQGILIPLLSVIAVLVLAGMGSQFLLLRGNPARRAAGAARKYGLKGGTICKKCGSPFPIHFWSLNLIGGYLDRCDTCGKVAFVRPVSQAELRAAEQAELAAARSGESAIPGVGVVSEEERLRKLVEESRYQDQ